ncbi:MAG: hypothetical protein ACLGI9_14085 [Thermoanaerobaculia bacterium]
MGTREWPSWWDWELELSPHLLKRMIDRSFTEVDLRRMLEQATGLREDIVDGRWLAETWHLGHPWAVIVEPDAELQLLVVVTAYRVW